VDTLQVAELLDLRQHVQQRDAVVDPVQHVHVLRRRCHRAVQYLTRGARA